MQGGKMWASLLWIVYCSDRHQSCMCALCLLTQSTQRSVKACARRACGPAMRALLLHQARCPTNLCNFRSHCPFWRHTQLSKRASAATSRAVTAQSAATEAGTHKCACGLHCRTYQSPSFLSHQRLARHCRLLLCLAGGLLTQRLRRLTTPARNSLTTEGCASA